MSETAIVGRDDLLAGMGKRRFEVVTIGGKAYRLRSLFESEYGMLIARTPGSDDEILSRRRELLALCLCDADGNPLLSMEEADRLRDLDQQVASELYEAADRLTGVTKPKN